MVAGVLVLMSGCVSRAGEPTAAGPTTTTTTTATTTTSPRPTAVTADPEIAAEAAEILASRDVERFNDRICPGTSGLRPVTALGPEYAGTRAAGITTRETLAYGDKVTAQLTVRPGQDLMLVLGLDFDTYEWCSYAIRWCPLGFTGLPPFPYEDGDAVREVEQRILCR